MKHTLQSRYMHRQAAEDDDLLMSLGSVDQSPKMLLRWWDSGAALDQICDVLCVTRPDLVGLQDTSGCLAELLGRASNRIVRTFEVFRSVPGSRHAT